MRLKFCKNAIDPSVLYNFLVACTRLYNPLCPPVGWSHFTFFYDFIYLTSLLLPKWSGDLKYGPFRPARDFGSRVSALVKGKLGVSPYFLHDFLDKNGARVILKNELYLKTLGVYISIIF